MQNEQSDDKCRYCRVSKHILIDCKKVKKSLRKDRWQFVKRSGLCYKCLASRHNKETCPAPACDIDNCGPLHHRLLHYNINTNQASSVNIADITDNEEIEPQSEYPFKTLRRLTSQITTLMTISKQCYATDIIKKPQLLIGQDHYHLMLPLHI